jgi:hypothetical protein
MLGWTIPLMIIFGMAIILSDFVIRSSISEMINFAQTILSWRGLLILVGMLATASVINTLLGLIGLLVMLRKEAIRLDFIKTDDKALYCYDFVGRERLRFLWSDIRSYIQVERQIGSEMSAALSYDFIITADEKRLRLPSSTTWFNHLRSEILRLSGQTPKRLRIYWFGLQFVALAITMSVAAALTILLTQGTTIEIPIRLRAWLAAVVVTAAYVIQFSVTAIWLVHYFQVHSLVSPTKQFIPVIGILGLFLLAAGIFGKLLIFFWGPLFIFWGLLLWVGLVQILPAPKQWRRRLPTRLFDGTLVLIGCCLVLRSMLPIVINGYAFTYFGAAIKPSNPENPPAVFQEARAEYFYQMGQAGLWIQRIDPTYFIGYGLSGYADYSQSHYTASIENYTRAMDFGGDSFLPDYHYCRALAYSKRAEPGDEIRAQQDCQTFYGRRGTDLTAPSCALLFPKDTWMCHASQGGK